MDTAVFYIALQSVLGIASSKIRPILKHFGNAENVFSASKSELDQCGYFSDAQIINICMGTLEKARHTKDVCDNLGIDVTPIGYPGYPERLSSIADPPALLYTLGDMPDLDSEVAVAVVGTRHPSHYGYEMAQNISYDLAASGAVVISGGALGVDSACHLGAINAGGKTVAVLGSGIHANYLMQNGKLRETVAQNGALVSELPPYTPVRKFSFPVRNRIISGLSLGTAVIEAGERSGALNTASHAAEQGRDIFVLPGRVNDPGFLGSNRLLKDGAKPLFSALDILEEYTSSFEGKLDLSKAEADNNSRPALNRQDRSAPVYKTPAKDNINKEYKADKFLLPDPPEGLSADAIVVYNSFKNFRMGQDDLINLSGLPANKAMCALTELELFGAVESMSGGIFRILTKSSDTSF